MLFDLQEFVNQETEILDRRAINGHACYPSEASRMYARGRENHAPYENWSIGPEKCGLVVFRRPCDHKKRPDA